MNELVLTKTKIDGLAPLPAADRLDAIDALNLGTPGDANLAR